MNRYALGKQETLAALCEEKAGYIKELEVRVADLDKKLDQAIDLLDCNERAWLLDSWIIKKP